MGLFDKQKCCICGKEGRLHGEYNSAEGKKYLCSKCEEAMHVSGFSSVNLKFGNDISYETLKNYQKFYFNVSKILKEKSETDELRAAAFGDIVISPEVICFPEYKDFFILTSTVYAVVYADVWTKSDNDTDIFMITLFTTSPSMPYYSMLFYGDTDFLSFKSKKTREAVFNVFSIFCQDLKYPIGKAKDIRKMIKADPQYDLPIEKNKLLGWLGDANDLFGHFSFKHCDNRTLNWEWANNFFLDNGFLEIL